MCACVCVCVCVAGEGEQIFKGLPLILFLTAVVKCPPLSSEANSMMSGCRNRAFNIYGDKCLFYCKRGYVRTSGSTERKCLANSRWTGSPLKCEGELS